MKAVFQLFWQMCLMRQSPQYVPTRTWFITTVICANIVCSVMLGLALDETSGFVTLLTQIIVGQATTAGLLWLALYLRDLPNRFPATLTALFGCDLIITVCMLVLLPLALALSFGNGVTIFVYLTFILWSLAVAGYILYQALNLRVGIGVLVALGMMILSVAMSEVAVSTA